MHPRWCRGQRSNVDHRPRVRRSDAGGRPAITFLRPRAERPQICSTHGALVRAIGDALGAQGTALGLGFKLWLTPEQSHFSPFQGQARDLSGEPGDSPWIKGPIRGVMSERGWRTQASQARCFATTGPTCPRAAAQLVRLFERSRASIAKLAQSSDGSDECISSAGRSRAAVESAVSSSSGIASRSC